MGGRFNCMKPPKGLPAHESPKLKTGKPRASFLLIYHGVRIKWLLVRLLNLLVQRG
jgi:hypothetical protein